MPIATEARKTRTAMMLMRGIGTFTSSAPVRFLDIAPTAPIGNILFPLLLIELFYQLVDCESECRCFFDVPSCNPSELPFAVGLRHGRRRHVADECADPPPRFENPLPLELRVDLCDRVRVHRQIDRHLSDRWQLRARRQLPGRDGAPDAPLELRVDRRRVGRVYRK